MEFSPCHHVSNPAEPQRAAAGRFLPREPVGALSDGWLVAKVS